MAGMRRREPLRKSASVYTGMKATFDSAARQYAAARPSYPTELIQAVIDRARLPKSGRILEIGCGTGQATLPFAARGYAMLCLEPGANLAAVAAERLQPFPNVAVETVMFEDWPLQEGVFDLVMSAQAFHWVPPEVGYPKASKALKPNGSVALFWNLVPDEPTDVQQETDLVELSGAIQSQYVLHAPELAHVQQENSLETQVATVETQLRSRSDLFCDLSVLRFPWSERYDAERYVALLSTYSGHIALPAERQQALFAGIAWAIQGHKSGFLLKRYVSVLFLARKAMRMA